MSSPQLFSFVVAVEERFDVSVPTPPHAIYETVMSLHLFLIQEMRRKRAGEDIDLIQILRDLYQVMMVELGADIPKVSPRTRLAEVPRRR